MGAKRKDTLQGVLFADTGSFFDPAVQKVLEEMSPPEDFLKELPEEDRLKELAFPIEAYDLTEALASASRPQKVSEDWAYHYSAQPELMADLLVAVTKYHRLPEGEKNLTRKVADAEAYLIRPKVKFDSKTDIRTRLIALSSGSRLPSWAEVVKRIDCKDIDEDRIRAKEFYEERKRRAGILAKWKPNTEAFWKILNATLDHRHT